MSERPFLAYFTDKDLRYRVMYIKKDEPVNAGSSKEIDLWAMNITKNELVDVCITVDDKETTVTPSRIPSMRKGEVVKITVTWKPSINRETKLLTKLRSVAIEVIR